MTRKLISAVTVAALLCGCHPSDYQTASKTEVDALKTQIEQMRGMISIITNHDAKMYVTVTNLVYAGKNDSELVGDLIPRVQKAFDAHSNVIFGITGKVSNLEELTRLQQQLLESDKNISDQIISNLGVISIRLDSLEKSRHL